MTFSPTGSSGLWTVQGTPYTFDVEFDSPGRSTAAEGADHHIPYSNVTYLQSAGSGATKFRFNIYLPTMTAFLQLEAAVGGIGALQTVYDGLWLAARLDSLEFVRLNPVEQTVDARVSFTACRTLSL
jgi:hypothetical protein